MATKKQLFLLLPLLLLVAGSLVEAAPKGKGRQQQSVEVGGEAESAVGQMPASAYGGAGFGGRGESVKDAEGNTEMVQEADNEVDEEEGVAAPEDHQQVPMMNAGSGRMPLEEMPEEKREGEEFEERGSLHPQEHEAAIGDGQRQLGDVRHYKPALESGHIGEEDEAAHRFGEREEGEKSEDEAGADEREEKEHKGEEEEEDGNAAENSGVPQGEGEEEKKKRVVADEGHDHHQNDGEDDKFMHIYPFLHGATSEAIAAFHALIRDQHLTKAEVEQKRGEWAKEQGEAIQKGFHDWKDQLAAKKQRVIGKIEEKLDSFADETKRLYIELKAIIADQTISRHQECEQIRSLVTSADEALRDDFLDKVKRMHLVKFCMEEEQQGGGGPMVAQPATKEVEEEGGERQQGPAQLSDGTDDLEQNHPPAQRVPMPAGAEADEHQQPSPIDEGGSQEQQPGLKEEEEEGTGNEIGGGKPEEEKTADEGTQDGTGDEEEADKLMAQGNGGTGHPHPHHQQEYEHPEEAEENEAGEGEGHEGMMQNDGAVPTGNKKLH